MFNKKIKEIRTKKKITLESMAQLMEVSKVTYTKWEKGETHPTANQLPKLATFLGVRINNLFEEENEAIDEEIKRLLKLVELLGKKEKIILNELLSALVYKSQRERLSEIENKEKDNAHDR